jgi:DNA-binding response OmpR family regulator
VARLLIVGDAAGDDIPAAVAIDGHEVTRAAGVDAAERLFQWAHFDVVVLLGSAPAACAWCSQFRADGGQTPVLAVINEPTTSARVTSLDCGADDVLVRPVANAELRAHVRALTRRGPLLRRNEVIRGDARLDFAARRAWRGESEISLTPGEWKIVDYLELNAGRVASRADILEALYGDIADARRASLEVLIGRIRRKLGPRFIRTVRGRGYAVG